MQIFFIDLEINKIKKIKTSLVFLLKNTDIPPPEINNIYDDAWRRLEFCFCCWL